MTLDIHYSERFDSRHNGPNNQEIDEMLSTIGVSSLDQLINETIPANIRIGQSLNLPKAKSEAVFLSDYF